MTRALFFLALACVIAVLAWQARAGAPGPVLPEPGGWRWDGDCIECVEYTVGMNDSLWAIAARYYPDEPIDKVVWAIREVNGLTGPTGPVIQPGQKLWIPDPAVYGVGRR